MRNPKHSRYIHPASRFAWMLLLLASAACGRAEAGDRPEHPERLDGAWTMELRVEHPATLTRDPAGVPPIRGSVMLLENDGARRISGPSGVPTHYGVYAADLRALDLGNAGRVPTLTARLTGADSVEIAFEPERAHPLIGRGVLAGDSVSGRWSVEGSRTAPGSSGRFTLHRP